MQVDKELSMAMLYYGLRLGIKQYELGGKFGNNLYAYFSKDNNWECVPHILKEWSCIEEDGRINLITLPNPVLVRPCGRLSTLYNSNGIPQPHDMFKEDDPQPDLFRRMVYTYRMAYDLIYLHNMPLSEPEAASNFVESTTLLELSDKLTPIIGP